ncbi:AraC family transcriptional regulator, partial [Helicobacter sp. UBA3407]|uniref:helix-turn-helix domain-containing protein n=1 Tax=Helicobacter sp. UBA3407 TaxID=1946588 RepID=UPI0026071EE0
KIINYLKENYNNHYSINDLAEMVNMSSATFHRHFKMVTTLSPIQYQKSLRLLEASRIIKYENATVSEAAFKVGYESISQFTREYKRMFSVTPKNKQ